jgi:ABC-2 type transport system permease protein
METVLKLTWVETKLFLREPLAVIFAFAFPLFVLFILTGVFGTELDRSDEEEVRVWRGVAPNDYYLPAYVGLVMAAIGLITMPLRLATYREQGVLRRFRAAGVPVVGVIGSQALVALGMAVLGSVVLVVFARGVYGTQLPDLWPQTLVAFALSAVMFAAIGVLLGSLLPTARTAQGAGLILFFVMMFISGAGPPREVLSSSMRTVSEGLPLTHVILLLQGTWLGFGWDGSALLVVVAVAVVSAAVSLRFFRWE